MFRWKKLGKVFDPKDLSDASWMNEFAQSPSVVIEETYVRVFFCSRPLPDSDGQYLSYIAYIDLDRNNLLHIRRVSHQPVLPLGKRYF